MFKAEDYKPEILSQEYTPITFAIYRESNDRDELFKFEAKIDDNNRSVYSLGGVSYFVKDYFKNLGCKITYHNLGGHRFGVISIPDRTAENYITIMSHNRKIQTSYIGTVIAGNTIANIPNVGFCMNIRDYYTKALGAKIEWRQENGKSYTDIILPEVDTGGSLIEDDQFEFLALSGKNLFKRQGFLGQDVIVAVIDTGVSPHPEFEDRLLPGVNVNSSYPDSQRNISTDEGGHGTHVAGSIAGKTCGVAPKAKILPIKVLHPTMGCNWLDLIAALKYARDWRGPNGERVDIINMSLGAPESYARRNPVEFRIFRDLVKHLVDNMGISVICASGNTGREENQYPGHLPEVVCVGAVDVNKKSANFSTRNKEVDVSQVGVDVISAYYKGGYAKFSGTSMATPIVAGIAALLISKYKSIFNKYMPEMVIYESLKLNTIDIGIPGIDTATGAGFCCLNPNPIKIELENNSDIVVVNGVEINLSNKTSITKDDITMQVKDLFKSIGAIIKKGDKNKFNIKY